MDPIKKDKMLKTAERFAQQGKFDDAIAEYRALSHADPDDLTVANTLGDLYVRQARFDDAIGHFTKVAERFSSTGHLVKSIAMYKKMAKLDPDNTELNLQIAELYAGQNLLAEARQQFVSVADRLKKQGHGRQALGIYKRIVELEPANHKSRMLLAMNLEAEGLRTDASEAYRAAGQEMMRRGDATEGVAAFKKALDLRPESRGALKALAEAHATAGDVQKGLDVIVRALEVDPNDIDLIIILGRTFLNAGMLGKAEHTFEELFKLDNSRYDYLLETARAYVARDDFDSAMAIVDQCIELLLARRQKKKATALLKSILERDPINTQAIKRLAGIYKSVRERRNLVTTLNTLVQASLSQGQRAEAAAALRQLIEIEPKRAVWQQQLESLGHAVHGGVATIEESKGLAVVDDSGGEVFGDAGDSYDSYGDYSTELLAEMVSQHPEFLAARLKLLEDLVTQQPAYIEGRLKLKNHYIDGGQTAKAASQCLDIARHYEEAGDSELARKYLLEAFHLNPELKRPGGLLADGTPGGVEDTGTAAGTEPARTVRLSELMGVEDFEEHFIAEWQRASDEPKPITIMKIVVDRFETYEDHQGPVKSLSCLERIAVVLQGELTRDGQRLACAGNEEFFALLPETHPGSASSIADGMRRGVEGLDIAHPTAGKVTVSLGIATAFPYKSSDAEQVIESINSAVNTAQKNGGNRVITVPLMGGS